MEKVSTQSIDNLVNKSGKGLVSIYLPTHRQSMPPNVQEDQTRYKNLVREAAEQLVEHIDEREVELTKDKLLSYLDNREFWQNLTEGLAIFVSKAEIEMYCLPIEIEDYVHVGTEFDVAPLVVVNEMNQPFYVLALAMQGSRIFKGNSYGLEELTIELPESIEGALNIDEMFANSSTMPMRGHEGAGGLGHNIGPHGQGDSTDAVNAERLKYFRIIEEDLYDSSEFGDKIPLIIAATDNEAGDFMAMTKLPNVVDDFIRGNHTRTNLDELHQQAWSMMSAKVIKKSAVDLVDKYQEQKGQDRSSSSYEDIKQAADLGRVDTLLVDMLEVTADSVRDVDRSVLRLSFDKDYTSKDWLGLIKTVIKNGGRIVGLQAGIMPDGSKLAAMYRY